MSMRVRNRLMMGKLGVELWGRRLRGSIKNCEIRENVAIQAKSAFKKTKNKQ